MPRSFDTKSAPFDRLTEEEAAELVGALDIGYWRKGETILARGVASEHYHVVLKGAVEEHDDDEHIVAVLGPRRRSDRGRWYTAVPVRATWRSRRR